MSYIRFVDLDYSSFATITATSAAVGFPATNAANDRRSLPWRPGGNFEVTSSRNLIYINDGSDKTVTLTPASYTYATLAAHIQAQLNAASTLWSCSYDFSGGTFKFTISRSSSGTLRFSQTTDAAWDMLGFTLAVDTAGTEFVAQEIRNHTSERYEFSLGTGQVPTFIGVIGLLGEAFVPSNAATLKLLGNGMPVWTAPSLQETLTKTDRGVHHWIANTNPYSYYALELVDRTNPAGPSGFNFGRIVLGEYVELTMRNVNRGFVKANEDRTEVLTSERGVRFYNQKTKYRSMSALEITAMEEADRIQAETLFDDLGVSTPFFISFDPDLMVTPTLDDLTFYGTFEATPKLRHLINRYYTMTFDFREAV